MAIFPGTAITPAGGGYTIDQSLRFNDDDSAYLSRTPASAGNLTTSTWSFWVKRGNLGGYQTMFGSRPGTTVDFTHIAFKENTDDCLVFAVYETGAIRCMLETTQQFRDPSHWYHVVVVWDSSNATSGDRARIYINNARVTDFYTETYPSLNQSMTRWNTNNANYIGTHSSNINNLFDGYMAEVHFIDGQALDPSYFGETDEDYGHWKPIAYTGSYGTNGFYLDFSNSGSIGEDQAGSNDFTANNLAATDVVLDSPTNNFAVLNPLSTLPIRGTYTEGNLRYVGASTSRRSDGIIGVSTGKWYWEVCLFTAPNGSRSSSSAYNAFGFGLTAVFDAVTNPSTVTNSVHLADNGWYKNFSGSWTDGGTAFSVNDVLAVAVDLDANTFTFYRNNSSITTGTIGGTAGRELLPIIISYNAVYGGMHCNFGQDSSFAGNKTAQNNTDANGVGDFYYAPPSGFLALCTANLPDPAVVPGENFNTVLYTGNGSTQSITGIGFQPDWVWIKNRVSSSEGNIVFDSVRGANKRLITDGTQAESTPSPAGLSSFDSDGFSLGAYTGTNTNNNAHVAWNWKADNTSGSTNTDGSITSTVAANPDAGFSIVNWVGTQTNSTIGHGLTQPPEMMILKCRESLEGWFVYHESIGNTVRLNLDRNVATSTSVEYWNNTSPTSSVFTVGINDGTNDSGFNMIAYCFHSVDGFSKFGSYTGNGSSDGPFIYTGFRPAFVLTKRTDTSGYSWYLFDAERSTYNVVDDILFPNGSDAETVNSSSGQLDFLSNGFKIRGTNAGFNASSSTQIFMAFSEYPFKFTNAR
jgi:hypothetical protein